MAAVIKAIAAVLTWDARFTASGPATNDDVGSSVSLSGDRALVGAYGDDDNGIDSRSGSEATLVFGICLWR